MIKLFSSSSFKLLRNYSGASSLVNFQYKYFSTHKAFNWDQHFPYTSILNEKSFDKIAPSLKNFSPENLLEFQKVLNQYISGRDATLLSKVDANNLAMVIWKMGSMAQTAKNPSEAEAYYLEALEITKKTQEESLSTVIMIQNNLGWLYQNMGELEKALICLENVASLIEETKDFVDFDSVKVRNLYFTAKVLQGQGKQDEAIEMLNKMLRTAENDEHPPAPYMVTTAYKDIGDIHLEREEVEKALEEYERGIKFTKDFYGDDAVGLEDLYRAAGEAYLMQENDTKVVEYMKKCIEISEKHDKMNFLDLYTLAFAQFQMKDHDGFLHNAQRFIDITGSGTQLERKASLYQMMCIVHYMRNNVSLAEKCFGSLITILKALYGEQSLEVADAYLERVDLLGEQEVTKSSYRIALQDAINAAMTNETLHPSRLLNLFLRAGESFANDEEWSQALTCLEEIQKLSPEKYFAEDGDKLEYVNLITAKTYCYLGRYEEGLVYAEKAKALCEASGDPHNRMNDLNESIRHIHESIKQGKSSQ